MSTDPVDGGRSSCAMTSDIGYLLFDSLVHHLIEKGLLTKNDALSVVQSAAEVVRGQIEERADAGALAASLSTLERTFASFQAMPDRHGRRGMDGENVTPLRAPRHGERPRFPSDDD